MKNTKADDFLYELKDLIDYAVEARCWSTVDEIRELIYEELDEELFEENEEEGDE